ncbi:MAG: 2-C-methyl-D-erythritol 4-phosphate cytidylyltransferase [Firmicutes bacterium]|nr:2-C-methyl-D-erythritol 4-phosphate cytidylyltransferase [Bacillota bacterium]
MDIPYIIVAGGKGIRMGANLPKQYIEINGKPIIYHTISNLVKAGIKRFIVVIDISYIKYLKKVLNTLSADIKYVAGGQERIDSVMNGLKALDEKDEFVAIHDSVRPLISKKLINSLHAKMLEGTFSGVIPALRMKDTIKVTTGGVIDKTLVRTNLRRIGTPQVVKVKDFLLAINKIGEDTVSLTDDASILELNDYLVGIVEGEEEAFKITDAYDLKIFKILLGVEK